MRYFDPLLGDVPDDHFLELSGQNNMVHVWEIGLQGKNENRELQNILSVDELNRANRFHFKKDRFRYVFTRSMLRVLLSRYLISSPLQIKFQYNNYGKPHLKRNIHYSNIEFNVSHSDQLVLIAVSGNGPIGIDIEKKRYFKNYLEIINGFFSQKEKDILSNIPNDERLHYFYALWSRKEAYVKALGGGMSIGFDTFSVVKQQFDFPDEIFEEQTGYLINDLILNTEYVAAVAVHGNKQVIKHYRV